MGNFLRGIITGLFFSPFIAYGSLIGEPHATGGREGQEATISLTLTEVISAVGGLAFDVVFDGDLISAPRIKSNYPGLLVLTHEVASAIPPSGTGTLPNRKTLRVVILKNPAAIIAQTATPTLQIGLQVKDVDDPPQTSTVYFCRETAGDTGAPSDGSEKRPRSLAGVSLGDCTINIVDASAHEWLKYK